jgi:exopolysaccharide biosynthesis WecB/TagA/CpsF family protein
VSKVVSVLGVKVGVLSSQAALEGIKELLAKGGAHSLFFVNAHTLNLAYEDPEYRAALNSADLVLNDGIGVEIAARLFGVRFPENLVGTDFIPKLCTLARDRNLSLYLLGSKPGVAEMAATKLQRSFPGIDVVGTHHGYFSKEEEDEVIRAIQEASPDVLLVGFGNPLQEKWIALHRGLLRVPLSLGVGAFIDFVAGRVRRAPCWAQRARMEWVFRLVLEPRRLWRRYIQGNPKFLWRVLRARVFATIGWREDDRWA